MHNILPLVSYGGPRYSVPPETLGQLVEVRRAVGSDRIEARWVGRLIAAHTVVAGRGIDVWDPTHRQAAETAVMQIRPQRPVVRLVAPSPGPDPSRASTSSPSTCPSATR